MPERDLTPGMQAAIAAPVVLPVLFYEGEYEGGTLNLWTGRGDYVWNAKTWLGGGRLLAISSIQESDSITAQGFSVTLSGMPSSLVAIALASVRQNKPGTLWLGCFDAADALILDPYLLARGKFDIVVIEDDGTKCSITANYEGELIDLEKPRERRYTHEDQKIDYPADTGFRYMQSLQDASLAGWYRG